MNGKHSGCSQPIKYNFTAFGKLCIQSVTVCQKHIKIKVVSRDHRCIQLLLIALPYLQVKEFAVSPVDDLGGGVGVSDIDEVHLVRERQTQTREEPLGTQPLCQRHRSTTLAQVHSLS